MQKTESIPPTKAELDTLERLTRIGWFDLGDVQQRVLHKAGWPPNRPMVGCLIEEIRRLQKFFDDWILHPKITRLWDLCRHQRNELHCVNLISDDEFSALAEDDKSVDRLETYDAAREEIRRLRKRYELPDLTPGWKDDSSTTPPQAPVVETDADKGTKRALHCENARLFETIIRLRAVCGKAAEHNEKLARRLGGPEEEAREDSWTKTLRAASEERG